jgi:hypothetical protein
MEQAQNGNPPASDMEVEDFIPEPASPPQPEQRKSIATEANATRGDTRKESIPVSNAPVPSNDMVIEDVELGSRTDSENVYGQQQNAAMTAPPMNSSSNHQKKSTHGLSNKEPDMVIEDFVDATDHAPAPVITQESTGSMDFPRSPKLVPPPRQESKDARSYYRADDTGNNANAVTTPYDKNLGLEPIGEEGAKERLDSEEEDAELANRVWEPPSYDLAQEYYQHHL